MFSKADADAVRAHNRRVVLDHLRRAGVSTRKAMSEDTGLSLSSTSAIATGLLRAGLIAEIEEDERASRRGRPGKSLRFAGAVARIAAVRIAVGEVAVRISDYAGAPVAEARRELDIAGLDGVALIGLIREILAEAGFGTGRAGGEKAMERRIVVAVQGKTDSSLRRILWSPALRARDIDVAKPLAAASGAETAVLNDCSLMPEAFRWSPDFAGRDFATLFIGFGVGMGLRLGGATFQGQRSSAVEFGHINHIPGGALCRCGNRGCVEAYAGDYAILRAATGARDAIAARRIPDADMHSLAARARAGDGPARAAFATAGQAIGYGLGRMFTLIDPLPVVFTGSGAHAMDLLEPHIRAGIGESAIDGSGRDTPFSLAQEVDEMIFNAATSHALAGLDEVFSRAGGHAQAKQAA